MVCWPNYTAQYSTHFPMTILKLQSNVCTKGGSRETFYSWLSFERIQNHPFVFPFCLLIKLNCKVQLTFRSFLFCSQWLLKDKELERFLHSYNMFQPHQFNSSFQEPCPWDIWIIHFKVSLSNVLLFLLMLDQDFQISVKGKQNCKLMIHLFPQNYYWLFYELSLIKTYGWCSQVSFFLNEIAFAQINPMKRFWNHYR